MNEYVEKLEAMVKTMDKYASGDFFIWNDELFPIDERDFSEMRGCAIRKMSVLDDIYMFYIMPDGEKIKEEDLPVASITEYIKNFLSVVYIVDTDKEYLGCRVTLSVHVYIDTSQKQIIYNCGKNIYNIAIPDYICDIIDERFSDDYYYLWDAIVSFTYLKMDVIQKHDNNNRLELFQSIFL